jgi:DNA-binding NtrC family response regulator
MIRAALDVDGGNVTHAAARLGLSRRGLQLKMKEFGLRQADN